MFNRATCCGKSDVPLSCHYHRRLCAFTHFCNRILICRYRFPSTVNLLCAARPEIAGTKQSTAFNLVVQRPRIAGGTLIILLDSTVTLTEEFSNDTDRHILRLQYGSNGKHLNMRSSSSQEHQRWLITITAAMSPPFHPDNGPTSSTGNVPKRTIRSRMTKRTKKAQSALQSTSRQRGCSIRRVIRQNVPAAMQVFLTFGQIIASVAK